MGTVTEMKQPERYEIDYLVDDDGKIFGVSHPKWVYDIVKKDNQVAFVDKETGEPFGILDRDQFNAVLMCWLLIDDPKMIDETAIK